MSANEKLFMELCVYWEDVTTHGEYLDFASGKWYQLKMDS